MQSLKHCKNTIIIGAGASGLMAAYSSENSLILEKNDKAGKKIYITGKGRCNVTNDVSARDFINNVVTNPKFLLGAINKFTPLQTVEFFNEHNAPLKLERGGRYFPLSDKASDITSALLRAVESKKTKINYNEWVIDISVLNDGTKQVTTNKSKYSCKNLIIAAGGASYASTGSSGDGFMLAKKLGHKILPLRPALCGVVIKQPLCQELQGLSLKNVRLDGYHKNKKASSFFGEMLFTHYGISGPIVLSSSSILSSVGAKDSFFLLDLKPALTEEMLDLRLLRDFTKFTLKSITNALTELLPKNLIPIIVSLAKISPQKTPSDITKAERLSLVKTIKNLRLDVHSLRPINESIVTGGGVCVDEINPTTMESKLIKGLYFCGEVIDVDAFTGGYNMQIAFSTGHLAGESASKNIKGEK